MMKSVAELAYDILTRDGVAPLMGTAFTQTEFETIKAAAAPQIRGKVVKSLRNDIHALGDYWNSPRQWYDAMRNIVNQYHGLVVEDMPYIAGGDDCPHTLYLSLDGERLDNVIVFTTYKINSDRWEVISYVS